VADIHYFHCQRIMQLLEEAEQGRAKNIFGQVVFLTAWYAQLLYAAPSHLCASSGYRQPPFPASPLVAPLIIRPSIMITG
jgi:hypothetical protein